jgi:hypothetical protein
MDIFVVFLTGKTVHLKVNGSDTVLSVKQSINEIEGIPLSSFQLIHKGQSLDDSKQLSEYSVQ